MAKTASPPPHQPEAFFTVRSDKLKELRASLTALRKLDYPIGAIAKFSLVVDTNVILGELRWLASKRTSEAATTSLMEVIDADTVQLYGPPALFAEVEEKIPLLAANQGLDKEAMSRHWLEYKSKIKLAEPTESVVQSLRSGADPDDAEFVALEKTLGADGVLSKDKHISMMGGNKISMDCVFHLRDYSRATAIELNIRIAGAHFAIMGSAGIRACANGIQALAKRFGAAPDWLKVALLLGALLTLAQPRARSKVLNAMKALVDGTASAAPSVIRLASVATQMAHENRAQANMHLENALSELARTKT